MIDVKKIDEIATKLNDAIPPGAKAFQEDMHAQFKQILQTMLSKMDIVTREEFDVQTKVLAKTRQKIDDLEKAIAALEEKQGQ
ncbi:ubiquinone biosynthesis accessory factor UbiK [Aliikangiella coralliicola]|uniref:Ubiquinone biosynthesis accessory factor UbiK n=1 Tax=Aliikangiella coralliicola TaxID=2592383 RepID=A0A545UG59_9GAMM|nr:accessory factor UbiK family protein [Aliikangiella coralliicola]TQV88425.1 accessory factor UbiK family protein [Aliikangiella coralliicola]